jgi:hypothetical protein
MRRCSGHVCDVLFERVGVCATIARRLLRISCDFRPPFTGLRIELGILVSPPRGGKTILQEGANSHLRLAYACSGCTLTVEAAKLLAYWSEKLSGAGGIAITLAPVVLLNLFGPVIVSFAQITSEQSNSHTSVVRAPRMGCEVAQDYSHTCHHRLDDHDRSRRFVNVFLNAVSCSR